MQPDWSPIVKLAYATLQQAATDRAKQIRIVPAAKSTALYFLIDGDWKHAMTIPRNISAAYINRFKALSGIEDGNQRSGTFEISICDRDLRFLVECSPTEFGDELLISQMASVE